MFFSFSVLFCLVYVYVKLQYLRLDLKYIKLLFCLAIIASLRVKRILYVKVTSICNRKIKRHIDFNAVSFVTWIYTRIMARCPL